MYLALYRKYRPSTFDDVISQEHITTTLKNQIATGQIAHAYLFTGTRGTGKTSCAKIMAKAVNCLSPVNGNPCGECKACRAIAEGSTDIIEIDAASNNGVDSIRQIRDEVIYTPIDCKYKVYIIDEVHMLSTTAFNALLKTLEEPPKNVIFILATTEVHKVLDTIKSRCQRFDFKRITTDDIVKHLRYISDQENINITDDALYSIAKNSAGGMRDSIALLDQLSVLDSTEAISTNDINNLLGRLSFDTLNSLADKIVKSNPQGAIEDLEKIYNSGNEPVQILTNLMDYLKNLLIVKNCAKEIALELSQANDAQYNSLSAQSKDVESHQIIFLIEKCAEYIKELKLTNNPRLWLEVAIIDLANLTENTKLVELQNRLARLEGGVVEPVKVTTYKTAPAPVTKPEIMKAEPVVPKVSELKQQQPIKEAPAKQIEEVEDFSPMPKSKPVEGTDISVLWGQLLSLVQSAPTRALLKQWANPVKITHEETILTMKNEIFLNQVQSGAKKQAVVDAVDTLFSQKGANVVIRLPLPSDVEVKAAPSIPQPKKAPVEDVQEIQEEIKEVQPPKETKKQPEALQSDNIKMVIDLFDGKVIE